MTVAELIHELEQQALVSGGLQQSVWLVDAATGARVALGVSTGIDGRGVYVALRPVAQPVEAG